ncbi:MAG TPA: hypothetical protein PLS28_06135 [Clostridiales bacterium]|nr:hypothetical protein [Clostridiales bacterium]
MYQSAEAAYAAPRKPVTRTKRSDSFALFLLRKAWNAPRNYWKRSGQTRKAILATTYALLLILMVVAGFASCSKPSETLSLSFDRAKDGSTIQLNDTTYELYGTVDADTKMEQIGYCEGATDYHVYQLKNYDTDTFIVVASIFSESNQYDVYRSVDSLKNPRCVTKL